MGIIVIIIAVAVRGVYDPYNLYDLEPQRLSEYFVNVFRFPRWESYLTSPGH